jgi:serine/threonine protein kinase
MTPERWSQIQEKLEVATALEPGSRAAYLEELGVADPNLREELESLLAQQSGSGEFLKTSAMFSLRQLNPQLDVMIGRRLGPYQVTDLIGIGGMGEVYRAFRADDEYKKQVAIKLVRAGQDSASVCGRFKNERQILASLDHPNIARLLDGGTTEGVPYLVMELIEGQPIDEYCDGRKLDITERLHLFTGVCAAVQYAHSRLIVHRDLKPGNILVTADGQPKLLDFGIAKILDPGVFGDGLPVTMTMLRVLTPAYASPEQIKGRTISTASDVYSLGVILYELLTGHHPYQVTERSPDAISHAVLEVEPEKPSSVVRRAEPGAGLNQPEITAVSVSAVREGAPDKLRKRLSGDLDNIVLMALRKEPERRYTSVEQLGEDIRRHLERLPVSASKGTLSYRASKFISRHRASVAAAAAVTITLLAGILITTREAQIARQQSEIAREQKARAEQRFSDLRQIANSFMFEFHDSIKDLAGSTPAQALLIQRSREYLDRLARDAKGDSSLQQELATAYIKLGDIQGNPRKADLGDAVGARASYGKAMAILEPLLSAESSNRSLQKQVASCYERLSLLSSSQQATDLLRKSAHIGEDLVAQNPGDVQLRRDLATTYADLSLRFGNPYVDNYVLGASQGLEYANKSLHIREQLYQAAPNDPAALFDLFEAYHYLADMLWVTGHLDQALHYEMSMRSKMLDFMIREPTNAEARRLLVTGDGRIANVLAENGQLSEALARVEPPTRGIIALGAADPKNVLVQRQVGSGYNLMGEILLKMGKINRAIEYHRKAVQLNLLVLSVDPTNLDSQYRVAKSYDLLANALAAGGALPEGFEDASKAVTIRKSLVAADPSDARARLALAGSFLHLGNIQEKRSYLQESLQNYREGLALMEPMTKSDPDNWIMQRVFADLALKSGMVEAALARRATPGSAQFADHHKESCRLFLKNLSVWQGLRQRNVLIDTDTPRATEALQRARDCAAVTYERSSLLERP